MAAEEKRFHVDGDTPMVDGQEPGSGQRVKSGPPSVQSLFDDFAMHSKGLTGAEFEQELDLLIDRIVERNVALAPPALREGLRDTMRSYLENDPTLTSMVAELRAAARR
jgi:hypothetical protein